MFFTFYKHKESELRISEKIVAEQGIKKYLFTKAQEIKINKSKYNNNNKLIKKCPFSANMMLPPTVKSHKIIKNI